MCDADAFYYTDDCAYGADNSDCTHGQMAMLVTACWPTSDGERTVGVVLMWDERSRSYTRP
jgi:hypothetical protein